MENKGPPQKSLLMKEIAGVGPREIREHFMKNLPNNLLAPVHLHFLANWQCMFYFCEHDSQKLSCQLSSGSPTFCRMARCLFYTSLSVCRMASMLLLASVER